MKHRKLRIAWSVGWAMLSTILLIPAFQTMGGDSEVSMPISALLVLTATFLFITIAPLLQFPKRFSLRTLLFGTTVVAVILWLAVWATK